jgi:hypothetical protein
LETKTFGIDEELHESPRKIDVVLYSIVVDNYLES